MSLYITDYCIALQGYRASHSRHIKHTHIQTHVHTGGGSPDPQSVTVSTNVHMHRLHPHAYNLYEFKRTQTGKTQVHTFTLALWSDSEV